MNWKKIDDKEIIHPDKPFVSCDEEYEISYIVNNLVKKLKINSIFAKKAVKDCCKEVKSPHPREKFIDCLKKKIDK